MARKPQSVPFEKLRRLPAARKGTSNAELQLCRYDQTSPKAATVISRLPLWIYDAGTDFSLTGSYGQSAGKRDFYPRNFSQPAWTFIGQTHNEREYGQIAEFIRNAQLMSIFSGPGSSQYIMRMVLPASNLTKVILQKMENGKLVNRSGIQGERRNQRGDRQGIKLQGYIESITRKHERFVPSQEYTFSFVTSQHIAGPIKDEPVPINVLKTNWDSFIKRDGAALVPNPDKEILDSALDLAEGITKPILDALK